MENVLTAQNVSVAKFMQVEGTTELIEKVDAALDSNPVTRKLMEAAQTVEDVYQIAKKYLEIKLEDFKIIFEKTVKYFKEEKTELPDEVMDTVVGGSFGDWLNKWKRNIITAAIAVGCTVVGAVTGACLGGGPGALALGLIGFGVGVGVAGAYNICTEE